MIQVGPQSSPSEIERFIEQAKHTYDERLASKLEPEHNGEIVAIEPESGDYFLGGMKLKLPTTRGLPVTKVRSISGALAPVMLTV